MNIFEDNSFTIGNTPLVRLHRIAPNAGANIIAKLESRNPAFSVKCRIGSSMIWQAEQDGLLGPDVELIEPTSGNTGIALAFVAAARGYKLTLTMPHTMSLERRQLMAAFGANLVLTDGALGMTGAIQEATRRVNADPERMLMLQQFENPANPAIHEKTTGPEIWRDTDGQIDVLVAGVGTGGTISGCSRYLKKMAAEVGRSLTTVAVEPASSSMITSALKGEKGSHAPHKIQGIGAGFVPKNLDLSIVDRCERVSDDDAFSHAHRMMQEEGVLCGISCGAAVAAAARLAYEPEFEGKNIVVILPDSGERYLRSPLFEGRFSDQELVQSIS